jgi:hypothetical protein
MRRRVDDSLDMRAGCRVRWTLQLTQLPILSGTWTETTDVGERDFFLTQRTRRFAIAIDRGPRKAKPKRTQFVNKPWKAWQ